MKCLEQSHELVAVLHLEPPANVEELDSYMYQTVGSLVSKAQAECLNVPLLCRTVSGTPVETGMKYESVVEKDEVEDLYILLKEAQERYPEVEGVASGALFSDYQRERVEAVCGRLGLKSLALLWHRDQNELLQEMIDSDLNAILIKVAVIGLSKDHVGKGLIEMFPHLKRLEEQFGINVCGEGGEFESLVLDCPIFRKRIVLDETESILHSDDAFAPVYLLKITRFHLEDKNFK